jgi:cob(I)alamin adenosyltransferase
MKIYTRTGDDGTTGLIGGARVRKPDRRLECTGTIDELNAAMGLAAVTLDGAISELVHQIQCDLFVIGSHLGCPDAESSQSSGLPMLDEQLVTRLEMQIDGAEQELPELRNFILPGGTDAAARLHLARTICRRAERVLADFSLDRPVSPIILTYINRLSDWLFVHARLANRRAGVDDVIWKKA